jgi:hypothetical protein
MKLKRAILVGTGIAVLALAPVAPVAAVGPVFPWILGRHVVGALVGLATLPLAAASAVLSAGASATTLSPPPGDDGRAPGFYRRGYDGLPLAALHYPAPRGNYRRGVSGRRAAPRFYESPRAYYAPRSRYAGAYGDHAPLQPGRLAYRRR